MTDQDVASFPPGLIAFPVQSVKLTFPYQAKPAKTPPLATLERHSQMSESVETKPETEAPAPVPVPAPVPEQTETTTETTAENDLPGIVETQDRTSILESVKRSAGKVFEKHGILFRRGTGRPRKDGMPNKASIPLNAPQTALPALATADPALPVQQGLDPVLVLACTSAVVKAVSGYLDKRLFKAAKLAGVKPESAQGIISECSITRDELDAFSKLAEICLRKYGVGTQYAPEIGIAAISIGVGVRYMTAFSTLADHAEQGK